MFTPDGGGGGDQEGKLIYKRTPTTGDGFHIEFMREDLVPCTTDASGEAPPGSSSTGALTLPMGGGHPLGGIQPG